MDKKIKIALMLGTMCLFLTAGIAIQIKDEAQRQLVFEKIISSFLIKNDASLI